MMSDVSVNHTEDDSVAGYDSSAANVTEKQITREVTINGWTFSVFADDAEPRLLDIEFATRLGVARPRDIRRLLRCLDEHGHLPGVLKIIRKEQCQLRSGARRGRKTVAYYLDDRNALRTIRYCETKEVNRVIKEISSRFVLARRELSASHQMVHSAITMTGNEFLLSVVNTINAAIPAAFVRLAQSQACAPDPAPTVDESTVAGTIGQDRARRMILDRIKEIARQRVAGGGDSEYKRQLKVIDSGLRSFVHHGPGSAWARLPENKLSDAAQILDWFAKHDFAGREIRLAPPTFGTARPLPESGAMNSEHRGLRAHQTSESSLTSGTLQSKPGSLEKNEISRVASSNDVERASLRKPTPAEVCADFQKYETCYQRVRSLCPRRGPLGRSAVQHALTIAHWSFPENTEEFILKAKGKKPKNAGDVANKWFWYVSANSISKQMLSYSVLYAIKYDIEKRRNRPEWAEASSAAMFFFREDAE